MGCHRPVFQCGSGVRSPIRVRVKSLIFVKESEMTFNDPEDTFIHLLFHFPDAKQDSCPLPWKRGLDAGLALAGEGEHRGRGGSEWKELIPCDTRRAVFPAPGLRWSGRWQLPGLGPSEAGEPSAGARRRAGTEIEEEPVLC